MAADVSRDSAIVRFLGVGLIGAFALAGCTDKQPIRWRADNAEQFKRDNYQCVQESRTSWSGGGSGIIGPTMMLAAKSHAEAESRRLYILCMEARGYTQVKSGRTYIGIERGLRIDGLDADGPAMKAGLLVNDVISEVDGRRIVATNDLRAVIGSKTAGDTINLLVVRDGVEQRFPVIVGKRP